MRQRERTNRTFVPLWNVDITSLPVITEWVLMVLLKSLNWIPTHLLLSWLYLNSLQQWSSRHRLPHRIKLTHLMLNSARDEIFVTLVSLFENNIYRSSQWILDKTDKVWKDIAGKWHVLEHVVSSPATHKQWKKTNTGSYTLITGQLPLFHS